MLKNKVQSKASFLDDIEMNSYTEIKFFKGVFWGLIFVMPFWIIVTALLIWLYK
ncbi:MULTISPECIES: hypothetical protein [Bacillus cereus group]|uniref:Uncharacterized protein n=2 Tax=Bacillus cereus TaxID=1396 RepID=A0A9W5RBN5_BACCE|nr:MULTISPECIES: hypothetical protein [Bacillus cereus group]HDR4587763.1 hypothetical protein [Bacillus cytotoxicus]HDR7253875.1 hypothetical protein [Bacillus pacificus]AJI08823.1 hypothetical protein AK40_5635 [Bacillus cereus 03BB108]EDX60096.1 conserved domain protein [Bacillus cereus 03BB108]EOQ19722.1 hypothetical protein IKC_04196 [Bacillus cereus VD184]